MTWVEVHPENIRVDFPGSTYPGSVVGSDPWDDDNPATYTVATTTTVDERRNIGDIPQQALVGVTKFELVVEWASDSDPSIGDYLRAAAEIQVDDIQIVTFGGEDPGDSAAHVPTDELHHVFTITDVQSSTTGDYGALDELVAAVNSENANIQVRPLTSFTAPPLVPHRLVTYELVLRFWIPDTTAIRQWPRDDSRGVNAVTRVWPAPRAGRVIGGQP